MAADTVSSAVLLQVAGLRVSHGAIEAVRGIDFRVAAGCCVALLGPNGAGKTSTISALCGLVKAGGSIIFDGQEMSGVPAELRVRKGISVAPEGRRVFADLSVEENLHLGGAILADVRARKRAVEEWFAMFPILGERRDQAAGTLSGGEQQMLAIARALMSKPKILLLDEPSLGLAPMIAARIFRMIRELKESGMTILLVEQNAAQALTLSDEAYLLNNGRIIAGGSAGALGKNDSLMAALTGIG